MTSKEFSIFNVKEANNRMCCLLLPVDYRKRRILTGWVSFFPHTGELQNSCSITSIADMCGASLQGTKRENSNMNEAGNIWDVVASLAHALSDARDQLVGLIIHDGDARGFQRGHGTEKTHRSAGEGIVHHTNDGVAMRCRGGGGCCGNNVPSSKKVRSVHRQHAQGHSAFGNHSEFKPELFNSQPCKPVTMAVNYSPPRRRGCGKPGGGVSISFGPSSCPSQSICKKDSNCRSPCPSPGYECKRHCIGNQYVAVLREEACRVRDRRLQKQCGNSNAKPRWVRC